MEGILTKNNIALFIQRTEKIQEHTPANWGKMNAAQMFQHVNKSVQSLFDDTKIKRMFMGRIIGKLILNKAIKDEQPIVKNSPTAPSFVSDKSVDFNKEKATWISYLEKFSKLNEKELEGKIHPFFGKMTGKQWNVLIYKHIDHHLKQFETNN